MQCYTELTPPTAVTHAVNLPLLAPKANNLVVAKASLLQIFELKSITTEVASNAHEDADYALQRTNTSNPNGAFLEGELSLQRTENTSKLVLVSEYTLSGTIIGLQGVKILSSKSGGEALLVAFKDAKLSLVEWDPQTYSLSTISIHYYEGEELLNNPWAPDIGRCHNYLAVDPSNRCAALKFGPRQLAILPFRQAGDDLVEDYDPELDGPRDESPTKPGAANGDESSHETPYGASFVLPLTAMDPALTHPIHLASLYEYREPTFGVLSASRAPSNSLIYERRDPLTYNVFTLDIEQKASTTILSVSGLPYDLYKVVALPLPVGGTLLVGANELVHVDQAGKTTAVAINEFAKSTSSFAMSDQSDLRLRLEGCIVQQLGETPDLLVVLNSGELVLLAFKMDGRSISGLSVHKVAEAKGGSTLRAMASCAVNLGRNKLFIGSEDDDSVVLGWTRKAPQLSRKRSHAEMLAGDIDIELDEDELDDGDDDLYDTGPTLSRTTSVSAAGAAGPEGYTFRIHDALPNLGPMKDVTLGRTSPDSKGFSDNPHSFKVIASTGRGRAGGIGIINKALDPVILQQSSLSSTQALWTVHPKRPPPRGLTAGANEDSEATLSADADYDQYLVVSRPTGNDDEESAIYQITPTGIEQCSKGDFESDAGATIELGTLAGGTRIVQVLSSQVKSYGAELDMEQILPMEDEETGAELKVLAASFCDPYVLLIRNDSSVVVLEADKGGDIDEIARNGQAAEKKWVSGCMYKSAETNDTPLICLLSVQGGLAIFDVSKFDQPAWATEGLNLLSTIITKDFVSRRAAAREALTELVLADLGDQVAKSPYLVIRTENDDLAIYQPFHYPVSSQGEPFTTNLQWRKVPQPRLTSYSDDTSSQPERQSRLTVLNDIGGYSSIFHAGPSPSFILKEASSSPKVVPLGSGAVRGLTSFHTAQYDRGFAYVDVKGDFHICQLPPSHRFADSGWPTRKVDFGEQVDALAYYDPQDCYVMGTCNKMDYKLPDDDYHHEWGREETTFLPQTDQGMLKLLHPGNWSVIDAFPLEPSEVVMTIKTLNLEVSEETHKRKPLIAVGTAIIRGEDLPTKGAIYLFDVHSVVPELDRPETNRKLKLIVREEVKGAVTTLCEIGTQGFFLVAQGQKVMVRGLKEDETILPTAFWDVQCYTSVAKSLKGTGMVILGDLVKGLWFMGYMEEPYKMQVFGRTRSKMEVVTAEFLPYDKQLYIVIADADCNLHVMQFDPDHPNSLSGQRLLHKSTFHTGHFATTMTLLPDHPIPHTPGSSAAATTLVMNGSISPDTAPIHAQTQQVLLSTQSGSLALLTPLDEQSYRRLSALQTHFHSSGEHTCGLNPRAYRAVESDGFGSRGVIDGGLLVRGWAGLGARARAEAGGKVGVEGWILRGDLEGVGRVSGF